MRREGLWRAGSLRVRRSEILRAAEQKHHAPDAALVVEQEFVYCVHGAGTGVGAAGGGTAGRAVGHLLARDKNEAGGSWRAWVSRAQETGGRHVHKVIRVRAASPRPPEPPEACQQVLRRVRGLDGKIRGAG